MGLESRPQSGGAERNPGIDSLAKANAILQARLALLHHKDTHPDRSIDSDNPENNSSQIRNDAMSEWVGDGSAALFRNYIDANPLNSEESRDLRQVLENIGEHNGKDTIH